MSESVFPANLDRLTVPAVRIGMLTPSSNSVLEPVLGRMTAALPDVSVHFARIRVTQIALAPEALGQFDAAPMLAAADLLADAKVASICWNGTSAGWLGIERDRALCRAITDRTRVRATSSVIALGELLRRRGVRRIAIVSPYTDDVQQEILDTFSAEGFGCVAERHAGIRVNFDFSEISPAQISQLVREAAAAAPEAILIFCTNMWGALIARDLETELGIPILDTVATALWGGLSEAGLSPSRVQQWGQCFSW